MEQRPGETARPDTQSGAARRACRRSTAAGPLTSHPIARFRWDPDVQRGQILGEHDLTREARGSRRMRGEVEQVLLFLASLRKLFEILRLDDDMTGRAGHH